MTIPIRIVLVVGFCGLLAVSLGIVIYTGVSGALSNTLALIAGNSVRMVEHAEQRLSDELSPIEAQAAWIAENFSTGRLTFDDPQKLRLSLESSMAALPDLAGMVVVDTQGHGFRFLSKWQVVEGPPVQAVSVESDSPLGRAIESAREIKIPVWRRPVWVAELAQTAINLHTPLVRNGQFLGLLIQGKVVADLSDRLRDFDWWGSGATPFLLYDGNQVLAHPSLAEGALNATTEAPLPTVSAFDDPVLQSLPNMAPLQVQDFGEDERFKLGQVFIENRRYLISYAQFSGLAADKPITVGLYVDEDQYRPLRTKIYEMIGASLTVLAISVAITLWLAKQTGQPIRALAAASNRVAAGDLDHVPALPHSRLRELDAASRGFERMVAGLKERERILDLFGRVVPQKVAERMLHAPDGLAPQQAEATVLFCDLAHFTNMTEELGPEKVVTVLNAYFTDLVDVIHTFDGIVTQFQGDAILAVFNLPMADPDHAFKAIEAGTVIQRHLNRQTYEGERLTARIGIATGPLIAAMVGAESRLNYTVHGDTVNVAARLEELNKALDTHILIADSAVNAAKASLAAANTPHLKSLGPQIIRGRETPVTVFTIASE